MLITQNIAEHLNKTIEYSEYILESVGDNSEETKKKELKELRNKKFKQIYDE